MTFTFSIIFNIKNYSYEQLFVRKMCRVATLIFKFTQSFSSPSFSRQCINQSETPIPDLICLYGRIYKDKFVESDYTDQNALNNAIKWFVRKNNNKNSKSCFTTPATPHHTKPHLTTPTTPHHTNHTTTPTTPHHTNHTPPHLTTPYQTSSGIRKGLMRSRMSMQASTWQHCWSFQASNSLPIPSCNKSVCRLLHSFNSRFFTIQYNTI